MNELLRDWRNLLPLAGLAVLAAVGIVFAFRRKPEDQEASERLRRAYLNRVGRIAEGHILEVADHEPFAVQGAKSNSVIAGKSALGASLSQQSKPAALFSRRRNADASQTRTLLHYSYAISGVSYETAQDITGLEERLHLARVAAGQIASVKYDPSNPSNSILLADDWSGLH